MQFSKKYPLEISFIEHSNPNISAIHMDAIKKIRKCRKTLKNDYSKMSDNLKEQLIEEIQKYRGRIHFHKAKRRKAKLKYKDVEMIVPVNSMGMILPSKFRGYKKEIINQLQKNREDRKKQNEKVTFIGRIDYSLYGGVHKKQKTILKLFREIAKNRVNSPRNPKAEENHVGLEIEFFSNYDRDTVCNFFIDAKLSQFVRIMTDVSIKPSSEKPVGLELCLIAPESRLEEIVRRACEVLTDLDAKTNESCGLHVHLDCRNRSQVTLFYNMVKCQDLLFKLVDPSRTGNKFCLKQRSPIWEKANTGHYAAINKGSYLKHKTIEIRMHHGTTNYNEIILWVKLLIKIANYNKHFKDINSVDRISKILKLDNNLKQKLNTKMSINKKNPEQGRVTATELMFDTARDFYYTRQWLDWGM